MREVTLLVEVDETDQRVEKYLEHLENAGYTLVPHAATLVARRLENSIAVMAHEAAEAAIKECPESHWEDEIASFDPDDFTVQDDED